jgi:outer membrane biosynthesis protein TonB
VSRFDAPTYATGGSAASQADSLDERMWRARRGLSIAIRIVILIVPMAAGFIAVQLVVGVAGRPAGDLAFVAWLVALCGLATAASLVVQRQLRRLAPLAVLFKMSLVFPDEAPSRFRVALRAGTGRRLRETAAEGKGTEQAAAEELLVLLARLARHDRMTRGHTERVRAYSIMLAEELGLPAEDLQRLTWAALAHDLGKLDVPSEILNKAGRPTAAEWDVLRGHPGAAARYVEPLRPWLGDWVDAATQHHERWDGGGYPAGLAGNDITLSGRIVAIADAYDVMTAARSYKAPLPAEQARAELLRNAGTQFDPALVRAFLQVSLGRMRWTLGPLGWLSHLPDLLRAPIAGVTTSGSGLVAAGAATLAATAVAVAPPATTTLPEQGIAMELTMDDPWPTTEPPRQATTTTEATTTTTKATTTTAEPTTEPTATQAPTTEPTTTTAQAPTTEPTTTTAEPTTEPTTTTAQAPTTTVQTTTTAGSNQGADCLAVQGGQRPLSGLDLVNCDLTAFAFSGEDLTGANLAGANLADVDLAFATLVGGNFSGTDFSGADLFRADMTGSNFDGATFVSADLQSADLRGASARNADFTDAGMRKALLDTTEVEGADFTDAFLKDATGQPNNGPTAIWSNTTCPDGEVQSTSCYS